MKRIFVFIFILGSCGGVPENVDKKSDLSVQTAPSTDSVDKGAKDASMKAIVKTLEEEKKKSSKIVGKEVKPELNLNLLVRNIKEKQILDIKNKLGEPKRIRIEPPGGIIKALFLSGIAMASTNLLFSLLAWVGKDEVLFAISVLLDDLATAFATIAFVAFISLLVDRKYTATQYALLASIGTAGRTILASSSGSIIDNWLAGSWVWFFIITTLLVTPSLYILFLIRKKVRFS